MSPALNTWAMHYQSVWEERAADPAYPLWCRVAWLAYARHKANGNANFQRGQIGRYSAVSVKTDSNRWTRTTYSARSDRPKRLACLIFRPVRNAWLCRHMRLRAGGADALAVRALSMYERWRSAGSAPSALVGE